MTKHIYLNLLATIWRYAKGMRVRLVLTYFLFIIANLVFLLEPYFLGQFLNVIQENGPNMVKESAIYLGGYSLLALGFWTFHGPARTIERVMSFKIFQNFADRMFYIVTKLPLKWHKDNHSGKTIDKINRAGKALKDFTEEGYVYIEAVVPFFGSLGAIIIMIKWDALYLLGFGILALLIIFRFDRVLTATLREINKKEHKVSAAFYDYIGNIVTIITLRLERLAKNEFVRKIHSILPVYRKNVIVNETKWVVVDILLNIGFFITLMIFVYKSVAMGTTLMVGTVTMLYGYINKFTNVFYGLAWKYEKLVMTSTTLTTIDSILEAYDQYDLSKKIKNIGNNWEKIEIRNLAFKYEDEKHKVHTLKDINLDFKKGLKIALVGESGGGKSTLMSILRGLTPANHLDISVDGKNHKDIRVLSGITTMIPQDPEIFENTIEYNITMGIPQKKKEVMKAIKLACFDKVLKRLPEGLDTDIRERGVNLSGGEKQRLALARGIFAAEESSIILLDEPTSSVDSVNELQIYKNLFKVFSNKCLISTVHRLHLLNLFDMVYVINEGEIVEQGTFKELLSKKGYLGRQWKSYVDKR